MRGHSRKVNSTPPEEAKLGDGWIVNSFHGILVEPHYQDHQKEPGSHSISSPEPDGACRVGDRVELYTRSWYLFLK